MATKLNPAAVNDKWGGVLCLTLGSTKPDNFEEILTAFDKIIHDKKHYVISVFDEVSNLFMGDAELLLSHNGFDYALLSNEQPYKDGTHITFKWFRYGFNRDGYYSRTDRFYNFASLDDYNALQTQIDELKQQAFALQLEKDVLEKANEL